MAKISLTTNVDLQNYGHRIDTIAEHMKPLGIEIFSLPQNYANRQMLELPEQQEQDSGKPVLLSRELARDVGKILRQNNIRRVQYHYPHQKTIMDMNGHDIALTIQFCDIILEESRAEKMSINYHNAMKYPPPSVAYELGGKTRKKVHDMLEQQASISYAIKDKIGSKCLLIVENNPATSIIQDKKTGEGLLDNTDLVAEDILREGTDGINLDYSHAWSVVEYFKGDNRQPNLEWCRRQYGEVPFSARSMKRFVKKVAPKTEWIHLSDEPHPHTHSGLHIGDGNIDFEECARLLEGLPADEMVATIEVGDGHTDEGFRRILEHDFPHLSKIFGNKVA